MRAKSFVSLFAALVMLAGAVPAHAHGHGHVGIWFGPVWGPGWWGPSYYYPPPRTVVIERSPEVYVQPAPQSQAPQSSGYWYYCKDAKAYYPYVKQCPGGWTKVSPTPPPEEGE